LIFILAKTGDYTARIIQTEANALEVGAATGSLSFRINGGLRVGGVSYAGGINIYRGNGDANALWGLNCSDGNLNIARGSGAGGTIAMGDSVINSVRGILANRAVAAHIRAIPGNFTGTPRSVRSLG
jgi:hypothetical protein